MNREIKFRGKRKDKINNEWYYGFLIIEQDKAYWIDYYVDGKRYTVEVIKESIGQFTGIKDKKGIEIYECDIIKTPRADWGVIVYKAPFFEVTVSETQSCMYTREWFNNVEVIGNIHENPELLKN